MKKRLSVVSKAAAAAQMLGIGLLFLISCTNIVAPSRENSAIGNGETGTARISFGNGVEGARTLLPTGVSFERYDLSIEAVGHDAVTVNDTVLAGSSALIELAAGDWIVHVNAYTDAGGLNKAAEGDSEVFTVEENSTTPVTVVLKAVNGADPGTLSVDIAGGDGGFIQYGYLYIYGGANFNNQVTFYNGSSNDTYAHIPSNGLDLDISLPSGQYRVFAYIYNNEGQAAYINEVAWIYSNLTTNLDRIIMPGDFADTTLISGTVRYAVNGEGQTSYELSVYTNPKRSGYSLGQTWISNAGEQSYTLRIPRPDKNIILYYFIYKDGNYFLADSVDLEAEKAEETKNINLNRSGITLSGSVAVTVGGSATANVQVIAEGGGFSFSGAASDGAWSISGIPSDFPGTLNLRVRAQYDGQWYEVYNAGSWTSGSPTTGIALSASFTLITGSFYVLENSAYIRDAYVYIDAYKESDWYPGSYNERLDGSFNFTWSGNLCTWYFATTALSPSSSTRARFTLNIGDRHTPATVVTVNASSVNTEQRTYTFTALSGAIGAVTVGVNPVENMNIYAISEQNVYYDGSIEGGAWTVYGIPSGFSGTLTIRVQAQYDSMGYSQDVATWTSGTAVTGIDLGDIDFTPYITLRGTLGAVTVGGNTPDIVRVIAGGHSGNSAGGAWMIRGIPDDFSGTLAIYVEAQYNGEVYRSPSVGSWTSGDSTTGIELGDVSFTPYIALSGSVAVTVDGNAPDIVRVYAYHQEGGDSVLGYDTYWGSVEGSSWTIRGIPPDFSGTLAIQVEAWYNEEWYYSPDVGSWTSGTPVTGIDLGNIDFTPNITLSGNIGTVTVGGNTAYNVSISAYEEGGGSSYSGNLADGVWTMRGIPEDFSGTLTIMVGAGYNGAWYSKAVGSWTPGDSTTIDLGNIDFTPNIILSGTIGAVTVNGNTPPYVSIYARTSDNTYSGSVDGSNWQIQLPGGFSGSVTIVVQAEYNNRGYSKDIVTRTVSGSSVPGITLGNVSFTFITLSGTIGAVTINGNTPSYVSIYARTSDGGYYSGSVDGGIWQIELPTGFSGSVTIAVQAESNGHWHSKDVGSWTSGLSTTINLGNVDITFLALSGTIGAVTVNGQTPSDMGIYAKASDGEYYWNYGDNSNWQLELPTDFSGTVTIRVEVEYSGIWYDKDVYTWTSGNPPTGIALGDVEFTFTPIGGGVTTDGSSPLESGSLYVFDPSEMPNFESQPLGGAEILDGDFSGYFEGSVTTGYVVIIPDESAYAYVTVSPVTLGSSMSFDLSTMFPVEMPDDPSGGDDPVSMAGGGGN